MNKPSRSTYRERMLNMIDILRNEISEGKYLPGTFLPAEKAMSERFSLSTNSVAKALDILEQEGLIEKISRVGSRVIRKEVVYFGIHNKMNRDIALGELLDAFHEDHPHIEVRPVTIPERYSSSSMLDELLASGRFDVVLMNPIYYKDLQEKKLLELLQPISVGEDIYPFIENELVTKGTCYVRPLAFSPVILCYNKDHFKEAGLSEPDSGWNWEELLRISDLLTQSTNKYGFYLEMQDALHRWLVIFLQKMSRSEAVDGVQLLDGVMSTFEFYDEFKEAESIISESFSSSTVLRLFREGKFSMFMTTYFLLNEFKLDSVQYDIAPLPYFTIPRTLVIWQGVSIYRKSSVLEAANVFVDFLSSNKGQEIIQRNTLSIPCKSTVTETQRDSSLNIPSRYQLFREVIPSYQFLSNSGLSIKAIEVIHQQLLLYATGIKNESDTRNEIVSLLLKI